MQEENNINSLEVIQMEFYFFLLIRENYLVVLVINLFVNGIVKENVSEY